MFQSSIFFCKTVQAVTPALLVSRRDATLPVSMHKQTRNRKSEARNQGHDEYENEMPHPIFCHLVFAPLSWPGISFLSVCASDLGAAANLTLTKPRR